MAESRSRSNKASSTAISSTERQLRAVELRKAGYTFQEIANEVDGLNSPTAARNAVLAALKKTLQEPTDELRRLECERLDVMIRSVWPFVLKGSPRHVEMALKIMDRRSALVGLDAPKQIEDHRSVTITVMAEQIAGELGLDPRELIAEAEAIVLKAASGGVV